MHVCCVPLTLDGTMVYVYRDVLRSVCAAACDMEEFVEKSVHLIIQSFHRHNAAFLEYFTLQHDVGNSQTV